MGKMGLCQLLRFQFTKGCVYMHVRVRVSERKRSSRQQALVEKGDPQTEKGHKRHIFYSLLILCICKELLGLSLFPRNGCLSAHCGASAPAGLI